MLEEAFLVIIHAADDWYGIGFQRIVPSHHAWMTIAKMTTMEKSSIRDGDELFLFEPLVGDLVVFLNGITCGM